jgi:hypothetical protein
MIHVTTVVRNDHGNQNLQAPPAWRVQSCTIDFGADRDRLTFSSDGVYASFDAAHEDMQQQAVEKIRTQRISLLRSRHCLALTSHWMRDELLMSQHVHNRWTILLMPLQRDNGLWACPYACERRGGADASLHRTVPPGLWETKQEAEAASLAHAKAWIDAQT